MEVFLGQCTSCDIVISRFGHHVILASKPSAVPGGFITDQFASLPYLFCACVSGTAILPAKRTWNRQQVKGFYTLGPWQINNTRNSCLLIFGMKAFHTGSDTNLPQKHKLILLSVSLVKAFCPAALLSAPYELQLTDSRFVDRDAGWCQHHPVMIHSVSLSTDAAICQL